MAKNYQNHTLQITIAQDSWQAHYQILSTISLKEFIKLKANMDMLIKNAKRVELNTKTVCTVLNIQIKVIKKSLMKT